MSGTKLYVETINITDGNGNISGKLYGNNNHIESSSSIIPNTNNTYNLGNTGARWNTVYSTTNNLGTNENGWSLGTTGTFGDTGYDLIAQQQTPSGVTGPVYSLIKNPLNKLVANLITVDGTYGNDSQGALYPFSSPFKTIGAAIAASTTGNCVHIYSGTYNESITLKSGIAVRGDSVQTVTIQKTGVTSDTTLATMDNNCRLEDVTLTLTGGANNLKLVGVDFINNAAVTAKLRTSVVNVNSGTYTNCIAYGVQSGGTGSNIFNYSSSNAIRSTTVNVNMGMTGGTGCGIIVNNSNHFTCRDTNIFSQGPTGYDGNTGSYIVGVVVNSPNGNTGILDLRTSTVSGSTFDVARPSGNLLLGFTDLVNSTTDGNSFGVTTRVPNMTYSLAGNLSSGVTYYLVPGSVSTNDAPDYPYAVPFDQNTVLINSVIQYTGDQLNANIITVDIYKNNITSPSIYSTVFTGAGTAVTGAVYNYKSVNYTQSATFLYPNDTLILRVTSNSNKNKSVVSVQLAEY